MIRYQFFFFLCMYISYRRYTKSIRVHPNPTSLILMFAQRVLVVLVEHACKRSHSSYPRFTSHHLLSHGGAAPSRFDGGVAPEALLHLQMQMEGGSRPERGKRVDSNYWILYRIYNHSWLRLFFWYQCIHFISLDMNLSEEWDSPKWWLKEGNYTCLDSICSDIPIYIYIIIVAYWALNGKYDLILISVCFSSVISTAIMFSKSRI